jgi:hypothetical protein
MLKSLSSRMMEDERVRSSAVPLRMALFHHGLGDAASPCLKGARSSGTAIQKPHQPA